MSSEANVIFVDSNSSLEEHFASEWRINHFSHMTMPLCTRVFSPVMETDLKFLFQIWYKAIDVKEVGDISSLNVTLKKLPGYLVPESLLLDLHVAVHYSNGKIYEKYRTPSTVYVSNMSSLTCIDSATRFTDKVLMGSSLGSPHNGVLIQSKSLILRCRMKFSRHLPPTAAYHDGKKSLLNLTRFVGNFKDLYKSKAFSDISIQIGDKTIKSHRSVLASHSPVFRRMLENEFKESKTGVINISGVDYDTLVYFLKYLYCAELENKSLANLQQMYSLADIYDVQTLKQKCVEIILGSCLEVSRICDILEMAYCYNDDILKKAAKVYAADHIKEILPTLEWKTLAALNPVIGYEVLLYAY